MEWPVHETLKLETVELIRFMYFCERRELGIICIESERIVTVDGKDYPMAYKGAIYVGRGTQEIIFKSIHKGRPAKYYLASSPAHAVYPTVRIDTEMRRTRDLGTLETSNKRTLNQLILSEIVPFCQLQMGLTELQPGSVWNTMPPHTHLRRMEAYFILKFLKNKRLVILWVSRKKPVIYLWVMNKRLFHLCDLFMLRQEQVITTSCQWQTIET